MADFLAAYLIVGEDELKREFVTDRLVKRIAALGDLDFNRDVFMGPAATADEVVAACNTLPFMSEYRLVQVKDVDKASKAVTEAIVAYLKDPSETTVLAMTANALKKNTRLYKAVAALDKKAVVDCSPKDKNDLPSQVQGFARSHRVEMSPAVAQELINMVGESTVHLDTEIKKMAVALGPGAVIEMAHLNQYVTRVSEVKPWEFVDAVSDRDARKAALLYSRMTSQSVFGLLTMTLNRLRELLIAKDLERNGQRNALARELGRKEWQVRNYWRWAGKFTQAELEHAVVSAADLERNMKSGGDQNALFEQWALELCTRG